MRFYLFGPRLFRGLIRPGISFGPEDFRQRKPSPRRQLQGTFIYVIRGDHGLIKIGTSINPSARLAQLRTASAVPLKIVYIAALRCDGRTIEAEAHRTLAPYRAAGYRYSPSNKAIMRRCSADVFVSLEGEWFDCPMDMAVAAIGAAAYKLGEPIASGDPRLADEVVRISQRISAPRDIVGSAVLTIVKFVAGIVLSLVAYASFYIVYLIATLR